MLRFLKKIIPKAVFKFFQPAYHYTLAFLGALIYRFPSRQLKVIGVTGTKGKTTTAEIVNAILEEAGLKTALASTLRLKVGAEEKRNLFKMTMPGRFFIQKFLKEATEAGCGHVILEMTSEGAKQYRHKFIDLDTLIFTNLSPEHIESHGSYEKYLDAKLSIARELEGKKGKTIIANIEDKEGEKFLNLNIENKIPFSVSQAVGVKADKNGSSFQVDKTVFHSKLPGIFNVSNALSAIALAKHEGIAEEIIKRAVEKIEFIRGRMEKIDCGQNFDVVVDYAHTPESLRAAYGSYSGTKKICVLGNTGGGRDKWKRPEMGKIAEKYCNQIILTNEDPYDEDPAQILEDMLSGIKNKNKVEVVLDRREAIRKAIQIASNSAKASLDKQGTRNQGGYVVLITGKGTDPYIMGPNGSKENWDDTTVTREELSKIIPKSLI